MILELTLEVMYAHVDVSRDVQFRSLGFHTDHTSRQRLKERQQLGAFDLLVDDPTPGGRYAMHLKNTLGQIQTHGFYCHWVDPVLAVDNNCTLARSITVQPEPSTLSCKGQLQ